MCFALCVYSSNGSTSTLTSQKVLAALKLDFHMVVICHVGTGNQICILILCVSSKCSYFLSHLFCPREKMFLLIAL